VANVVAFLHTISAIARKRDVFTPSVKWGPLSFMKLTHEAFRGALPKLRKALTALDADDVKSVHMFAALYSQFAIVHSEHANHEDEVIFKMFNDFFEEHAKKYNDDHAEDRLLMDDWQMDLNQLLADDVDGHAKREIVAKLKDVMPKFLTHLEEHLVGEEDHLNPIGRRYVPLELQKQISRKAFEMTDSSRHEVIVPFIVNNLPRHQQRVRYLKCLTWAMPERAQQIGAIVYRNSTAVMWERLRVELPEIAPRGTTNWRRYY
jgi:hemerythrin-like domain-containing protein